MLYIVFLVIFFILFTIITRQDLKQGIFVLIMLLPTYLLRFRVGTLPSTVLEIMVVIVFLQWLLMNRNNLKEQISIIVRSKFFWPGLVLVVAAGISVIWSPDKLSALGIWKAYFVEPFLLYGVLINTINAKDEWKKLFVVLGVTLIAFFVIALIQRITGWWSPVWEWTMAGSRRVTGPYTSPNALGLFVGPITVLYVALCLIEEKLSKRDKYFLAIVILAGLGSVLLAVSKGAVIAMAGSLSVLFFFRWSKKKTVLIASVLLLFLAAIPSTRHTILELATFGNPSGQSRLQLYKGSVSLLGENIFTGTGLAGFATVFEKVRPDNYYEILIYPHNIFLNFWMETGLLGMVSVLWIIYLVYLQTRKNRDHRVWLFTAALLTMLIHGMVDVPYFKNDLALLTWIMLAGVSCCQTSQQSFIQQS